MPVYWGVRWDLNPCHKEPQSSALPDWATNTVGIQGIEPWLLPYQGSFLTIRRYANIADTEWLEHSSFRFGVWGFTIKLSANYLVAGSGFAPLVSPLWVGQDYYFSNLLKHQIIDYFSLLHSENFQKWWHQVLQATWLNSLQKFLRGR